jgi:outer membrane receptor protein involved in Fe transport
MKQVIKRITVIFLLTLVSVSLVLSGTTGKIAGTITDLATGEALIGANIVVVGSSLGGSTDVNGQYVILYVPPGTYSVQISYIGYKPIMVNEVRVFIDQTARIDAKLEASAIEVGVTVVIAERNMIRQDVNTSMVAVSSKEISDLPVANVTDVLGLQAGINNGQIRGSGLEQALFLVDGATMRDARNNKAVTGVSLSSIREISIERGGFNAEYGQVQSGVVNVVTNEGKAKGYSGSINIRMTPPARKYYHGNGIPDIQDHNSYWLRPFFDTAVCWTGTTSGAWDEYTRKEYLSFNGWNAVSNALFLDYDVDAGFGGPVPLISERLGNLRFFTSYRRHREMLLFPTSRPDYSDYDYRLMLTSNITKKMKLSVSGMTGNVATMAENWNYDNFPRWPSDIGNATGGTGGYALVNVFSDMAYSITDIAHNSLSAKLTHSISSKLYYEVSLEYFNTKYNTRPPAARDTSQKFEVIPGYFATSAPLGYFSGTSDAVYLGIAQSDQQAMARDSTKSSSITFKTDVTWQMDFTNLVKAGIELNYNDLDFNYGFIQMGTGGAKYNWHVKKRSFPIRLGAYLQDKLEAKGFTLNAGVRLDYSNPRTDWWDFDPYDNNFYGYTYNDSKVFPMKPSKAQWQISPRLGISHPITENSKLYFNYGHFKQMPTYESLFRISRRADNTLQAIGDPNQILAKTVSYELGYDHQLFDNMLLIQLTAFYRDITDQGSNLSANNQSATTYTPIGAAPYTVSSSNNYGDIRGFELTIRKHTGRWINGFINFTYQATSNGHFGSSELYEDPSQYIDNYVLQTNKYYVSRSIPAPYARANLNFSTPQDFGPKLFRHNVFGDILLNLILNWSQGGWTTYNPNNAPGINNNVQYVDYYDGRIRASKTIALKHFSIQFYADVSNLFNLLRLRSGADGDQDYRRSLHFPTSLAYPNIPGDDKLGDYRKPGIEWQPMINGVDLSVPPTAQTSTRVIYYEQRTKTYWQNVNSAWSPVDQQRMDQINGDKAYIYMPNPSTFWFLNPRNITYGLNISFDLE